MANFGSSAESEKRVDFLTHMFVSAKIPRVIPNPLLAEEGEEPAYKVPDDMVGQHEHKILSTYFHIFVIFQLSCFIDGEFVVWLDNSASAAKPPYAKGVTKRGPVDPKTGISK